MIGEIALDRPPLMRHMDQIHARGIWIVEILNIRCLVVLTTDGQHTSCLSGCGCLNWRHETVSNLKISKNLKFQDFKTLDLKAHQVVNLPQPGMSTSRTNDRS